MCDESPGTGFEPSGPRGSGFAVGGQGIIQALSQ
jgi:hypothetical protein